MPAFGINTGTIAQQGLQSFDTGVDRQQELQKRQRQKAIDEANLRGKDISNNIAETMAPERLEAIRKQNRKAGIDIEGAYLDLSESERQEAIRQSTFQRDKQLKEDTVDYDLARKAGDMDNLDNEIQTERVVTDAERAGAHRDIEVAATEKAQSHNEGMEARAKHSVISQHMSRLKDKAYADLNASVLEAGNKAFKAQVQAAENEGRSLPDEAKRAQFEHIAQTLVTVGAINDGTEGGKRQALQMLRTSEVLGKPDIDDFEIVDGVLRGFKNGELYTDPDGFDDNGDPDTLEFNIDQINPDLLPKSLRESEGDTTDAKKRNPVEVMDAANKYQEQLREQLTEAQRINYNPTYNEERKTYEFSPAQQEETDELAKRASVLMEGGAASLSEAMSVASEFPSEYAQLAKVGISRARIATELDRQLQAAREQGRPAPSELAILRFAIKQAKADAKAKSTEQ